LHSRPDIAAGLSKQIFWRANPNPIEANGSIQLSESDNKTDESV
jgi:hypothetical protein